MIHTYKNYLFRSASNSDQSKIIELVALVLNEYKLKFDTEATDSDLLDIEQHYFGNNGYFGVIVNPDNEIVGSYGLLNLGDQVGEIKKMYILKEYRGMGFGKYSLQLLIDLARTLNYKKLEIETASVLKEALGLYRKFGFKDYDKQNLSAGRCDIAMHMHLA